MTKYIVTFKKESAEIATVANVGKEQLPSKFAEIFGAYGVTVDKIKNVFSIGTSFKGFAAELSEDEKNALEAACPYVNIEADGEVHAMA
ncbi:MAG: hypothetical protein MHM6MM_003269 [Cercozoa sp. M6MM]